MQKRQGLVWLCLIVILLFSCKHHSSAKKNVKAAIDTALIEQRIKTNQNASFAVYTDTAKSDSGIKASPYFSITNYYYDSTTGLLAKTEHILQSITKSSFVAYFDKGNVIKTISITDIGRIPCYFAGDEDIATSGFKGQCLRLAKAQQIRFDQWKKSKQ